MAEKTFQQYVQRERTRLHAERQALATQQKELDKKLAAVDRELEAVDAYEAARAGKKLLARGRKQTRAKGARRGSRREELINVIRSSEGMTRGQILEKLGLKGDKSGEMSVSNALTALIKGNQVRRDDRKYVAA